MTYNLSYTFTIIHSDDDLWKVELKYQFLKENMRIRRPIEF